MSRVHAHRSKEKPKKSPPPSVNIGDAETNQGVQEAGASYDATNQANQKPPIYKRVIAFIANKDNQSRVANIISLGMFFVTVVLAIYTYKVFNQTTKQTEIANKSAIAAKISADAAKISADLQKAALDSQVSAKKQSDIADAKKLKRDTDFINKQTGGIDAQIAAFKETQKQFEISHSPYIPVSGFGFNSADSLEIDIQNQGTQVAYLIEMDYAIKAERSDADVLKSFKTNQDWQKWLSIPNRNVSNMQSILPPAPAKLQGFKTWKPVSDADMSLVRERKKILYIRVIVYYYNTTTNKFMTYDVVDAWNPVDNLLLTIYFGYTVLKKYP